MLGNGKGPHIQLAAFCETVIEDRSGVLSLIRVIDQWTLSAQGPVVPEHLPSGQLGLTCVITLKSGEARGRHKLELVPELPSGQRLDAIATVPVNLEGGHRGNNLVMNLQYEVSQEGTHWFDVILNDNQLLTRMPLTVIYQPIQTRSA